jgi:hypothetical protein
MMMLKLLQNLTNLSRDTHIKTFNVIMPKSL